MRKDSSIPSLGATPGLGWFERGYPAPTGPAPRWPHTGGAVARRAVRVARRPLALAIALTVVATAAHALLPWALGHAIDALSTDGFGPALWLYLGCMLAFILIDTWIGDGLGEAYAVLAWLRTALLSARAVGHHVADVGPATTRSLSAGEVTATVSSDCGHLGNAVEILPRLIGTWVAAVLVIVLMFRESTSLALLILLGLPLTTGLLALVVKPLHQRQTTQRKQEGDLTTLATDTVSGLRILRGIGGEDVFSAAYRAQSQQVRTAGVAVAGPQSLLVAAQTLLPGAFTALVIWQGARLAVAGAITPGQLVTFFGYTAFLARPLGALTFALRSFTRGWVAAKKVAEVMAVEPIAGTLAERRSPTTASAPVGELVDAETGARFAAGQLTALVAPQPEAGQALAARLARLDDEQAAVTLAGTDVRELGWAAVRGTIVHSHATAQLFTGTLRGNLAPSVTDTAARSVAELIELERTADREPSAAGDTNPAERPGDTALLAALATADAHDVVSSLPRGLGGEVTEKGRSLSGGQRQRVALARALATQAPVLVLVEPTSAVDSHTEMRIAQALRQARADQTTIVVSASPLILEACDQVVFLDAEAGPTVSTHRELLDAAHRGQGLGRRYRQVVSRQAGDAEATPPTRPVGAQQAEGQEEN
ncbi:ABC transporter transmembrane domain-containing protein [Buchananella hordeovulneris]|uniref:ABC transporter transmembrane domain-containing protein n=1 Tax=Buchananella hordeovulneris TaxID=52770 RepID=UPI000F5E0D8D|nr:ABC transporter ATP-binding protein [Buchananella hordeovulneris]RRD43623.1 ABC transporter ATP-binding protein [Buchananella hordeovulneris]